MQKNGISAVFREIPSNVLTAEQLGLPAVISKLADLPRGLVLVTGPTGSGKSTTLAVKIVDRIIEVFPSTEQAQPFHPGRWSAGCGGPGIVQTDR